jgi:hypothetical protein
MEVVEGRVAAELTVLLAPESGGALDFEGASEGLRVAEGVAPAVIGARTFGGGATASEDSVGGAEVGTESSDWGGREEGEASTIGTGGAKSVGSAGCSTSSASDRTAIRSMSQGQLEE